jgi:hypothetical protein
MPTVPDLSDKRRTQFQHRANATSALFEAVKDRGFSRDDVRLSLEQIRYISFRHEVELWIRSGSESSMTGTPKRVAFDVRNRAFAKDAFQLLARELRIPHHLFDHGTLEPVFVPNMGFAVRVHAAPHTWTFLIALPDGSMLAPPSEDSQEVARGLASSNRQLWNILDRQGPVHLEKALEPRRIDYVGSKRVCLFLRNHTSSPSGYLYLPPSVDDCHLTPKIDCEALTAGQNKILLYGDTTKRLIATVTIPSKPDPVPLITWAKDVAPSPFKRFKTLAGYLRGKTSVLPASIDIEVYRQKKSEAHTQQRVLLGKQMSVPAWYPLNSLIVHASSSADGTRYLGLYPPGVSPLTNQPLRAFTLEDSRVHLKPADIKTVWPGLQERSNEVRALLEEVASPKAAKSRDAWLAIQELALEHPVLVSTLLLAQQSPYALHKERCLKNLADLPGWHVFRSSLETQLLEPQASSVPFVAHLLARAKGLRPFGRLGVLSYLEDVSFAQPSNPINLLTRLAITVPHALERSIHLLRTSHVEAIRELAGTGSVSELLRTLSTPSSKP